MTRMSPERAVTPCHVPASQAPRHERRSSHHPSPGPPSPHRDLGCSGGLLKGWGFLVVPHVGTALWQRPEQTRENVPPWELPGKWAEGLAVWGGSLPLVAFGALGVGWGCWGRHWLQQRLGVSSKAASPQDLACPRAS